MQMQKNLSVLPGCLRLGHCGNLSRAMPRCRTVINTAEEARHDNMQKYNKIRAMQAIIYRLMKADAD